LCEVGRASGVDPVSNKEVLWGEKGPRVKPTHTLGPFWCLDKLDHLAIAIPLPYFYTRVCCIGAELLRGFDKLC